MKRIYFYLVAVLICSAIMFMTPSCAVMFTGMKQKVTINSQPPDADVYLNLTKIGKTGEQVKIKRKDLVKLVTVKKGGYKDYPFEFDVKENWAMFLDIPWVFFGYGLIFGYVDLMLGCQYATKKIYDITLEKK